MSSASLLPFFFTLGPVGFLGFVLITLGLGTKNRKFVRWGSALLILTAVAVVAAIVIAVTRGR